MPGVNALPRWLVVAALGMTQIVAFGSTYYLPAVLAKPIAEEMGWPLTWVVGGFSLGVLMSGLISPRAGREIDRRGGRPVLAASAVVMACGLVLLGLAPNLAVYLLAWGVIGVGMAGGLYNAVFSTLGVLYGQQARGAITVLTLYGGFASTVCWPLSAFLLETLGWRGACFVYAALDVFVLLPMFLFLVPAPDAARLHSPVDAPAPPADGNGRSRRALFVLLAVILCLGAGINSAIAVHLLTILQAREISLAAAVALGALVGPSQVGARFVEMLFGRRFHPIWSLMLAVLLMFAGLGVLNVGFPAVAAGLVLYGAGVGIKSIARGTVPLAVFGAKGYPALMGRLAMPILIVQALAPPAGAVAIDWAGVDATLAILLALAAANIGCAALLMIWAKPARL